MEDYEEMELCRPGFKAGTDGDGDELYRKHPVTQEREKDFPEGVRQVRALTFLHSSPLRNGALLDGGNECRYFVCFRSAWRWG